MKKLTSVLLSVVMLMSVLCMPAWAVDAKDYLTVSASTDEETGMIAVKVVAQQTTTNGKFTIDFDSGYLKYAGASVDGIVVDVTEQGNTLTVGYANTTDEAVKRGRVIAEIYFDSIGSWNSTRIIVTLTQFNAIESMKAVLSDVTVNHPGQTEPPVDPDPVPPVDPDPIPPVNPDPVLPVDPTPAPGGDDKDEEPEVTVDPDGTVTETVKNDDGSTTVNVETPDGTTSTTVTDEDGNIVEASAEISKNVEDGETVTIPVEISVAADNEEAVNVEITVPATVKEVTVEIPVTEVTEGTVVVLVHEDGTEEIVNSTALTEDGLAITVDGSVTVKVVDNTKEFNDTEDHWAEKAVTFVTSREIFNGTGNDAFTPEGQMTRAMMMTVLARLGGHDTSVENGEDWAAPGIEWAIANGISDGSRPNENITREELATMLYLFAGAPETAGDLGDFTDADSVSDVAEAAMKWAVEMGIINGMGDGTLNPQGEATRAQLAKILMYFINL